MLKKLIDAICHPYIFKEKLRWRMEKKKLYSCGKGSFFSYNFRIKGHAMISVGERTIISNNCNIAYYGEIPGKILQPAISIGNDVTITPGCFVSCCNQVVLGDGTLLGENCFISDNFHGEISPHILDTIPNRRPLYSKGPVFIGKNVWLGRNVCVMPGVKIGDYAVVGANSVVTKDIPAKAVVGGVPAKIIRVLE